MHTPFIIALALIVAFLILADHSPDHDGPPCNFVIDDPGIDLVEQQFLVLINEYRADELGLPPFILSTTLSELSAWYAADMALNDYVAHTEPGGRTFSERLLECGYPPGGWAGENLAAGSPLASAFAVFESWRNSPGHDANMRQAEFTTIGIARIQLSGSVYGSYWVTVFGSLGDVGESPPAVIIFKDYAVVAGVAKDGP